MTTAKKPEATKLSHRARTAQALGRRIEAAAKSNGAMLRLIRSLTEDEADRAMTMVSRLSPAARQRFADIFLNTLADPPAVTWVRT